MYYKNKENKKKINQKKEIQRKSMNSKVIIIQIIIVLIIIYYKASIMIIVFHDNGKDYKDVQHKG